MNTRLTSILAIVLAALVVAYFWLGKAGEEREKAKEEKAKVVKIDPKKVVALDLLRAKPRDKRDAEFSMCSSCYGFSLKCQKQNSVQS